MTPNGIASGGKRGRKCGILSGHEGEGKQRGRKVGGPQRDEMKKTAEGGYTPS